MADNIFGGVFEFSPKRSFNDITTNSLTVNKKLKVANFEQNGTAIDMPDILNRLTNVSYDSGTQIFHISHEVDVDNLNGNTATVLGYLNNITSDVQSQIDAIQGQSWKEVVRVGSIANLNLSSMPATIQGLAMVNGDRFLAKDQTTSAENGIYIFNGSLSAATRSSDTNTANELEYAIVNIGFEDPTLSGNTYRESNQIVTLGTDPVSFTLFSYGTALAIGAFGSTPTANGATNTGNTLFLEPADSTHPGCVSLLTQTFAGAKTFTSNLTTGTSNGITLSSSNATVLFNSGTWGSASLNWGVSSGVLSTSVPFSLGNTTNSTSSTTGSFITAGGIGVAKDINNSGNIISSVGTGSVFHKILTGNASQALLQLSNTATGNDFIIYRESDGTAKFQNSAVQTMVISADGNTTTIFPSTASSSSATGCLVLGGGLGVAGNINCTNNTSTANFFRITATSVGINTSATFTNFSTGNTVPTLLVSNSSTSGGPTARLSAAGPAQVALSITAGQLSLDGGNITSDGTGNLNLASGKVYKINGSQIASINLSDVTNTSFSSTFTWDGTGSPGTTASVTITITKIGSFARMSIPVMSAATGIGSTQLSSNTNIPSGFRPTSSQQHVVMMNDVTAGGAYQFWQLIILTTGQILIFKAGNTFADGDTIGIVSYGECFTYFTS